MRRQLDRAEDQILEVHPGDLHPGEFVLDQLVLPDGPLELDALPRVLERELQAAVDHAERHRGDAGALRLEGALRALASAAALGEGRFAAQESIHADADVLQEEFAGRRGMHAHLAQPPGLFETGHAAFEDEVQDLAIAQIDLGLFELADEDGGIRVGAIRDEGLRTVEHELVSLAARRGSHSSEGIGSRAGFGNRPGADLVEGQQVERPAFLLLGRALAEDRRSGEADAHAHRRDHARAVAAQLDDRNQRRCGLVGLRGRVASPGAFLRRFARLLERDLLLESRLRHLVHAEGRVHLAQDVVGREIPVFELLDLGRDFRLEEAANRVADHQLGFAPFVHICLLDVRFRSRLRRSGHRVGLSGRRVASRSGVPSLTDSERFSRRRSALDGRAG